RARPGRAAGAPRRRGASGDRANRAATDQLPRAARARVEDLDLVLRSGVGQVDVRRRALVVDREPTARRAERDRAGLLRGRADGLVRVRHRIRRDDGVHALGADRYALRGVADVDAAVGDLRELVLHV